MSEFKYFQLSSHNLMMHKMKTLLTSLVALGYSICGVSAQSPENSPITIITWNIQVGSDKPPFENGWPTRKSALVAALKTTSADVMCLQEARLEQLQFIDPYFPKLTRIGVGRDDGKNAGEFCAIYFNKNRLQPLKSGTFWLSDTPDNSKNTWDMPYKRICTHALFKDKINGTQFVVLCTHFPLTEEARTKSAKLIAAKIKELYEGTPLLLCGDFNCGPDSPAWKTFAEAFLEPIDATHEKTYLENGKPKTCIDAIFKDEDIRAVEQKVLKNKYKNIYPSDHFGLLTKVFVPDVNR